MNPVLSDLLQRLVDQQALTPEVAQRLNGLGNQRLQLQAVQELPAAINIAVDQLCERLEHPAYRQADTDGTLLYDSRSTAASQLPSPRKGLSRFERWVSMAVGLTVVAALWHAWVPSKSILAPPVFAVEWVPEDWLRFTWESASPIHRYQPFYRLQESAPYQAMQEPLAGPDLIQRPPARGMVEFAVKVFDDQGRESDFSKPVKLFIGKKPLPMPSR